MNVLLAPDSFKGTLSALEAAQAMAAGVRRVCPDAAVRLLLMADGGEGTLEAVLAACPGELCDCVVSGPDGTSRAVRYATAQVDGARTAIIEVARVVGPGLPAVASCPVEARSTRGVGELLLHALAAGHRRFLVGLGGSSTNDGGAGLLAALGMVLRDAQGRPLAPTLQGMAALAGLDFGSLEPRLAQCDIRLLTDVRNPLCGARGATAVYGPQKGVARADVAAFDARLKRYAALGDAWVGRPVSRRAGAGAAGGLGYALQLLGARRCSGAEYLCRLLGVDRALREADLLITGEGRGDAQTLQGKAPAVLARHARAAGVPAALIAGSLDAAAMPALDRLFARCLALDRIAGPACAIRQPQRSLELACRHLLRYLLQAGSAGRRQTGTVA